MEKRVFFLVSLIILISMGCGVWAAWGGITPKSYNSQSYKINGETVIDDDRNGFFNEITANIFNAFITGYMSVSGPAVFRGDPSTTPTVCILAPVGPGNQVIFSVNNNAGNVFSIESDGDTSVAGVFTCLGKIIAGLPSPIESKVEVKATAEAKGLTVLVERSITDSYGYGAGFHYRNSASGNDQCFRGMNAGAEYTGAGNPCQIIGSTGGAVWNNAGTFNRAISDGNGLLGLYARNAVEAGTVNDSVGVYVEDPVGAGSILENYGLYINEMTRGTDNYAIYTNGSAPSLFGGDVYCDEIIPTEPLGAAHYSAKDDLKAELSPAEDDIMQYKGTAWAAVGLAGAGLDPANVVTVAKSGGDYTTIQAGIDAASVGDTVLVYPGTYTEQVTGKAGVTLLGMGGRDDVIIRHDDQGAGYSNASVRWNSSGTFNLQNLRVENLVAYQDPGGAASTVYTTNNAILVARGCAFVSSDNDTVAAAGASSQSYSGCYFETQNSQVDMFFFAGTGTHYVQNSICNISPSFIFINDTVTLYFSDNTILGSATGAMITTQDPGTTLYSIGNKFVGANAIIYPDDADFAGDCDIEGEAYFHSDFYLYKSTVKTLRWNETNGRLEFSGDGSTWDVNLLRGDNNTLTTGDSFACAVLKTGEEITRIDADGNILNCSQTDWDAAHGWGDHSAQNYLDDDVADDVDDLDIDWGTGADQVSQDDVVDGSTYKRTTNDFTSTYKGYLNQGVKTTDTPAFAQVTVDTIVLNGNDIDGGGTVDITDNLNVTGTLKAALSGGGGPANMYYDEATNEIKLGMEGACPIVFYRIDGGAWQCAGEIIKDANGNIFEGIVEFGNVKESLTVQIVNIKDEIDFIDQVVFIRQESPAPGIFRHIKIPVTDKWTRDADDIYRHLDKGEYLEYTIQATGWINLKVIGYYINTKPDTKKHDKFLKQRGEMELIKMN